ncbi:hypothetical protein [Rhodopseudomonas sp. B29]|uniref:hypothetical protein n=1 Tax=Rhodopseudomonas sp. B29 TaxID=95607 RepID=UPI0003448C69|nr:hypothetical protein [Rhodopseudomonas sp. B29]
MTDIDSGPASHQRCDKCGGEMKLLGRLPRRLQHPQRTVYRCENCDHIVQEQG